MILYQYVGDSSLALHCMSSDLRPRKVLAVFYFVILIVPSLEVR
jgi:hypothetical protein